MRFRTWLLSDVLGGIGRFFGITAAAALVLALSAVIGSAGDVSAPGGDNLNVTGAPVKLLPQTQGSENGWLSGLHVSGYASQTFGMWQNPTTLADFTASRNNLAVARSLLQVDENYRLNENNTFFMREWFVYEPPYSFDSANINGSPNMLGYNPLANRITAFAPLGIPNLGGAGAHSYGHFMNDWSNNYTVRDAWWENKAGPLTTYVGNQIVVWGQSLAFRVDDVVNPTDTTWAFGFANLEQSRTPQWMVHPILNLPEFGPLTSNFLEGVLIPGFQPMWTECDYPDGRYSGECQSKAGRVAVGAPSIMHGPSSRFDVHYDNQYRFGGNAQLVIPGFPFPGYGGFAHGLAAQPAAREFFACSQFHQPAIHTRGPNPFPAFLVHPCNLGLNKGTVPYGPTGDGAIVDIGQWRIPGMQPNNWNEGLRFHTLIGATELTATYFNNNTSFNFFPESLKWTPYTNLWTYQYSDNQEAGVTADRPLPMPAAVGEYLPLVGRAEVEYINHADPNGTMIPMDMTDQRYTDILEWMLAVDLDQAFAPWLTSTGNLSANVEVFDEMLMDDAKLAQWVGNDVTEHIGKHQISVLLNIGTSWWWEDFAPTFTGIWSPKGNTLLLFPSVVLNPPWTKKYFMKLQAIEVMGGDRQSPEGGLLKGESLLTAQFQYNFNLL